MEKNASKIWNHFSSYMFSAYKNLYSMFAFYWIAFDLFTMFHTVMNCLDQGVI
jgi:hypothetical protein